MGAALRKNQTIDVERNLLSVINHPAQISPLRREQLDRGELF